jgi:hypothetical protein
MSLQLTTTSRLTVLHQIRNTFTFIGKYIRSYLMMPINIQNLVDNVITPPTTPFRVLSLTRDSFHLMVKPSLLILEMLLILLAL